MPKVILRCFCIGLLSLFAVSGLAQHGSVKGKIVDGTTQQPLPYAHVYFNNTSIGTYTDAQGNFLLTHIPGVHDLIVSHVGYEPYKTRIKISSDEVPSYLIRLKVKLLADVQVNARRDYTWNRQLEKFQKAFFGKSKNTEHCTILNPWVLEFEEDNFGTLTARAIDAIHVENMSLGYTFLYQLSKFTVGPTQHLISGTVRFKEMQSSDTTVNLYWSKNRLSAYAGSYRHLYKSMIQNRVEEEGFQLFEDISNEIDVRRMSGFLSNINKNIIPFELQRVSKYDSNDHKYSIGFPKRLEIHYKGKSAPLTIYRTVPHPISWLEVKNGYLTISEQGIVLNPGEVTVLGVWNDQRMADILPYDYMPDGNALSFIPIEAEKKNKWIPLLEKPYVQTDKSYYYTRETIWIKAYLNYFAPAMRDSLSRILYVDIVLPNKKIFTTRLFEIGNGMAEGSITLPVDLPAGDYQLRAYTRWMLNFDPGFVFSKPIKILADTEIAESPQKEFSATPDTIASALTLSIISDKEKYKPREKITLTLQSKDFYGNSVPVNLSVAITDAQQVVPPSNEQTILTDFKIEKNLLPDSTITNLPYQIQAGIDISGRFLTTRQTKARGRIVFVQKKSNEAFIINTTHDGSFLIRDLFLHDSSMLHYQATQLKRRRNGYLVFDSLQISPPIIEIQPIVIKTTKIDSRKRSHLYLAPNSVRMLEGVEVKAEKIENSNKASIHTPADFQVTGAGLRERNSIDVLQAVRAQVPGIKVHIAMENGLPRKYLSFGISSFDQGSKNEPLLLVDGIALSGTDITVAERLSLLSPYEVEFIDIIKYGGGAAYGARGANGVIIIKTHKGTLETRPVEYESEKLSPLPVAGLSVIQKFVSPDYSSFTEVSEDYRSLIYWNPSVSLVGAEVQISFYAADLPTQYRIVVEGVAGGLGAVRAEKTILINERP